MILLTIMMNTIQTIKMQNISLNYDMIADIVIVEPLCSVQHRDLKKKCPLLRGVHYMDILLKLAL